MIRLSRAAALAATVLALAASTGCKKDEEKKAEPAAEPKPADVTAAPATGAAATPPVASGGTAAATAPGAPAAADPGVKPASVTDEQLKMADGIVAAITEFAEELDAAKGDCKKATAVVKTAGKKVQASMDQTEKLQAQLQADPAAMQWFQKSYGPKMMGSIGKLGAVVNACREDKDFEAAFKALDIGGKPRPAQPSPRHGTTPELGGPTPPPPPEPN